MDEAGERRALIVASDTYEDPKLRRLRAPAHDAKALAGVLGDPVVGDFAVTILENEPEYRLRRAIGGFFSKGDRKDVLLLHLACHGVKDEDGTLYFAAADTETDNLQATALPADFVNAQMNRSRSRRIVLLLDCCYSGAFARGMSHRADQGVQLKERFEGSGRVVLTASNSMEYAWEGDDLLGGGKPSVFTSALVQGLEAGEADLDKDGQVSVDELYDYVFERVRRETPSQTPGKWSFDVAGDLYIAKTRTGAEPVPLPDYLPDLIESPLPSARLSAVEALRLLLVGKHVGMALSARMALEQLMEDDSRAVSNAATEALAGAPETLLLVEPEQARKRTGPKRQGMAKGRALDGGHRRVREEAERRKPQDEAGHRKAERARLIAERRRDAKAPLKDEEARIGPTKPTRGVLGIVGGVILGAAYVAYVWRGAGDNRGLETAVGLLDVAIAAVLSVVAGVMTRRRPSPLVAGLLGALGLQMLGLAVSTQATWGALFLIGVIGNGLTIAGAILIGSLAIWTYRNWPERKLIHGPRPALVTSSLLTVAAIILLIGSVVPSDWAFHPVAWGWLHYIAISLLGVLAIVAVLAGRIHTATGLVLGVGLPNAFLYTAIWFQFGLTDAAPTVVAAWLVLLGGAILLWSIRRFTHAP